MMNKVFRNLIILFTFSVSKIQGLWDDYDDFDYIISTNKFPLKSNRPTLSNGHLGFEVFGDSIYMNGLYNGAHGNSQRARIPNFSNLQFSECPNKFSKCQYRLDIQKNFFGVIFEKDNFNITQYIYANIKFDRTIINQIKIKAIGNNSNSKEFKINMNIYDGGVTTDLFLEQSYTEEINGRDVTRIFYTNRINEDDNYQSEPSKVFVAYTSLTSPTLTLPASQNFVEYVHVVTISHDENEVKMEMEKILEGYNSSIFEDPHAVMSKRLFEDFDINVDNSQLLIIIRSSCFYLFRNLPLLDDRHIQNSQYFGLSPDGLGKNHKKGHSFWDTEIWMLPPILFMKPDYGKTILSYREFTSKVAKDNAINNGYEGYRYSRASAFTGRETTSYRDSKLIQQEHTTGAVAFGVQIYLLATHDLDWFQSTGCHIAYNTAKFWASRVTFNETTKRYDIKNVVGPDTNHYNISNNAYTNVIAAMNLNFGEFAGCICNNLEANEEEYLKFAEIADKLTLIYDEENDFYPQFEGYKNGTPISQADTILLGHPLQYKMKPSTKRNNLKFYENALQDDGPAMTWPMHVIELLGLGEYEKADELFTRSYKNYIQEPYNTWQEFIQLKNGAENFITGAGGFLQAIMNGYGGLKLYLNNLTISNLRLPPNTKSLKFKGLHYLKNRFDLEISERLASIVVTENNLNKAIDIWHNGQIVETSPKQKYFFNSSDTITLKPINNVFVNDFPRCKLRETVLNNRSSTINMTPMLNFLTILLLIKLISSV